MRIKERLITSFFIIIILPIILICFVGGVIINYQESSMKQSYDVESDTIQVITNPIQILNRLTRGVYNDIKTDALKEPSKFENENYLEILNNELNDKYSFIALRKNKEFIYSGNWSQLGVIAKEIPAFGDYNANVDGGIYVGGKNPFLIKQQDFYFTDGSEGSIFVITDVNNIVPQIKSFAVQMVVAFIMIICFTASILTLWIYRGILRPLNTLRIATNIMMEGNLDFSIHTDSDDEIGMLCQDFEKMRMRLKELIDCRLQYEVETRELISNISHDLKTPITAIKGYTEGIMDGVADTPEKMEKYLKTIYTKASDMTSLVDELALYSKIDCNSMPYNFLNVNLDRYFNDCINELTFDLEVKNIDLGYFNYTSNDLEIVADVEQLKRVINNIVGNSVKYIEKKRGIINIRIKEEDEQVRIEFEDNGKGIPEKDIENIFERFYRADASRNSSKGGSGLGLSIAKKIIEDHGGKIWAESKEGVGTSIFFTLKKYITEIPEQSKIITTEKQSGSAVSRLIRFRNNI